MAPRWTRLPGNGIAADEVEVGFISGVFGVRGEVRLHLHNRDTLLFEGRRVPVVVLTPDGERFKTMLESRPGAGQRVLGKLDGLQGREDAAAVKGYLLVVHETELGDLEEDEFFVKDVLGARVFVQGTPVGKVTEVFDSAEVLVLQVGRGSTARYVPCTQEFVAGIDDEGVHLHQEALEAE